MKPHALNYSSSCVDTISKQYGGKLLDVKKSDVGAFNVLSLLDASVKFILPDNGDLFEKRDDGDLFKEEWKDLMYLPYDIVAFEYINKENDKPIKTILLLFDLRSENELVKNFLQNSDINLPVFCEDAEKSSEILTGGSNNRYFCLVQFASPEEQGWGYIPIGVVLCVDDVEFKMSLKAIIANGSATGQLMLHNNMSFEEIFNESAFFLQQQIWVVMQALCILNCENIKKEDLNVPEKVVKHRKKKGLNSLYDYKILTIYSERTQKYELLGGSEPKSKKAHLRRGHLRRLQSKKVIYVKPTIVSGQNTNEFINKDYYLK